MNDDESTPRSAERIPEWDGAYWLVDDKLPAGGTVFNVRFELHSPAENPPSKARIEGLVKGVIASLQTQWPVILDSLGTSKWDWLATIERIQVTTHEGGWDAYRVRDSGDGDEGDECFCSGRIEP